MGSFFTPGKNEYFWRLTEYLKDKNVYITDRRLIPYTPDKLIDYMDTFPQEYVVFPKKQLDVYIHNVLVGQGILNDPTGTFLVQIPIPLGSFDLEVRDPIDGRVINRELYISKNYAMFFDVQAQSMEESRVAMEQNKKDIDYETIRTGRVFPNLGEYFDFPPPPGWSTDKYRMAIIGGLPDCPGFRRSFFYGGTIRGVVETIQSITCQVPTVGPVQEGERWTVFDRGIINPTDAASPDAWFVSDADDIPAPNKRALVMERDYIRNSVRIVIPGAQRSVSNEDVYKATNSFLEGPSAGPFALAGKTLTFRTEDLSNPHSFETFVTTFTAGATSAALAAAEILVQNPSLTTAVHGSTGDRLRLGVVPQAGKTFKITAVSGTAMVDFGFNPGKSAQVAPDILANPNHTGPVTLTYQGIFYVENTDFTIVEATGEIVWRASSALFAIAPIKGAVFQATYDYFMKREIEKMVNMVKPVSTELELVYA